MWLLFAVLSSLFLGLYDILKKVSLKENVVLPVLFLASSSSAAIFLVVIGVSRTGLISDMSLFYVPKIDAVQHLYFLLKAMIVGSSWFLSYLALKHLPITGCSY